ncbi:MAG: acyl-CoA dehydratase activase-related protein [Clostridiales bacterium]|jgi:predicted nucleotide-binding protein (sugar kinase/HSP70/actin superfamily)|nr:acyl-CoA dehydratase activase-related protein [Clostridiales bacterium]
MTIGLPRAFLYYRYRILWETFFENLSIQTVTSPPTNREILRKGTMYAIDEACLSSKIYLGHVEALIGKCDYIFVPRISNFGVREILCTKFSALYDIVSNTFRERDFNILEYNVDVRKSENEMSAFLKLGKAAGKKGRQVFFAYMMAKQAEKLEYEGNLQRQMILLKEKGLKVLVVGHGYNVYDAFVGEPVLNYLKSLGVTPIIAEIADRKKVRDLAADFSDTLPWVYNKELVGAVLDYKDRVDGIILLSAFPCGPDSLVNEIIIRRVKDKPVLNLLIDSQEAAGGVETRLESFTDILHTVHSGA